jgi:hypothetical protein
MIVEYSLLCCDSVDSSLWTHDVVGRTLQMEEGIYMITYTATVAMGGSY